jgi:hypothetical protein
VSRPAGAVGDIPFAEVFDMPAPPPMPEIPDGPVAVSLCHDEMLRLPDFLRHHRQIGVRHFFVVDNASTDGTGEYLDAQPDVTRLFSARPYQKLKAVFRAWPCDHYLPGRWIMEPDIDEHIVYPGWPEVPLPRLVDHWDAAGYQGVFAPMVDMYADRPLTELDHGPDARLLDVYPYFDAEGYWLAPPKPKTMKASPTPPALLFGGARTRFGTLGDDRRLRTRFARTMARRFMNHRNPAHPRPGARLIHRYLMQGSSKVIGVKSKIALIKWRRGIHFPGSNHRVNADLRLAPDWVALLHFRLMIDYAHREEMWHNRKHRDAAQYADRAESVTRMDPRGHGSRRLQSWRDLLDAGLVRMSPELEAALDPGATPAQ